MGESCFDRVPNFRVQINASPPVRGTQGRHRPRCWYDLLIDSVLCKSETLVALASICHDNVMDRFKLVLIVG